ncbi:MAG: (2Fe-2S)-binding protein [Chloroflexi bacterium]|nr:(2Fe-2S)-binding protein [Chloroflexota bacterium]
MEPRLVTLKVNGRTHHAALAPNTTLLHALRDLGYTDVKSGCEKGDCGACTVLVNNTPLNACLMLAWLAEGQEIVTVAGLGNAEHPHPLQQAFVDFGAAQCGYCTPGMILAAKALLDEHPHPTDDEMREALSGNLCRCTGYVRIIEAIQNAANELDAEQRG